MKQVNLTSDLYDYIASVSLKEHPVLQALRAETATLALGHMQITALQAQFMQWLLQLIQAQKILEVGTFTGYSALALSLALPPSGRLITCDINAEWTNKAQTYWQAANQADKIELRLQEAVITLEQLTITEPHSFDFIFIDADKSNYLVYYEYALKLIQPRGIVAIDNVLWSGKVIDYRQQNSQIKAIRSLNEFIKEDVRVNVSLLPIADGLLLVTPRN